MKYVMYVLLSILIISLGLFGYKYYTYISESNKIIDEITDIDNKINNMLEYINSNKEKYNEDINKNKEKVELLEKWKRKLEEVEKAL